MASLLNLQKRYAHSRMQSLLRLEQHPYSLHQIKHTFCVLEINNFFIKNLDSLRYPGNWPTIAPFDGPMGLSLYSMTIWASATMASRDRPCLTMDQQSVTNDHGLSWSTPVLHKWSLEPGLTVHALHVFEIYIKGLLILSQKVVMCPIESAIPFFASDDEKEICDYVFINSSSAWQNINPCSLLHQLLWAVFIEIGKQASIMP